MIEILDAELLRADLPLVRPFRTSFGEQRVRQAVLLRIRLRDGGGGGEAEGWGECVAMSEPLYSSEYAEGAWRVIRDFLLPLCLTVESPDDVTDRLAQIRGHRMAKACVEMAILDAWLRMRGASLASHLGGVREHVACGVSVGLAPTIDALLAEIGSYLEQGYRRIKVKVAPGEDLAILDAVRGTWPDVSLMADANAAYTLDDLATLARFDDYGLTMIEQPLAEGDMREHAILQASIATPVCLDESVESAKAAADAIALGACRIINVKAGRVGGYLEARRLHDVALARGIPVWCGGMLETGLGRAANLALASLEGFTIPGDTSASSRYFHEDLTEPFALAADGTMPVPAGPGIGVEPRPEALASMVALREKVAP